MEIQMQYGSTIRVENREYRTDILTRINSMLDAMIDKHNKVFVVRIDIRFPLHYEISPDKNPITEFYRRMMVYYKYHKIDAVYFSARERHTSHHPHYHSFILFDGNKVENGWGVQQKAAEIWQSLVGEGGAPNVQLCLTFEGLSGIMLRRPSTLYGDDLSNPQSIQFHTTKQVILDWLSYLAKTFTKGDVPPHTKEFHGSNLHS
jgi:hypothetical protein